MATSPGLPLSTSRLSKSLFRRALDMASPASTLVRTNGQAPVHCSGPMELRAFVPGQSTAIHTYDTGRDTAAFPPVWRCHCGFQLDAQPAPASVELQVRHR
jgi:hypothetical protein